VISTLLGRRRPARRRLTVLAGYAAVLGAVSVLVAAWARPSTVDSSTVDSRIGTPVVLAAASARGGADGAECASAAAGALLAGGRPAAACPADRLEPADADALRAVVRLLAGRGRRTLALAADGSARSVAAAATVRAAAARAGLAVVTPGSGRYPVVVVSGWTGAGRVVTAIGRGRLPAQGAYLAPWLLSTPLLQPGAGQLIALRYAPRDAPPLGYLAALAARLPGVQPSAAGYEAWQRVLHTSASAPPRLYAVAVPYLPGMGAPGDPTQHHHAGPADWLPGGMIIPVTGPLYA
jgi:hypothetical protein